MYVLSVILINLFIVEKIYGLNIKRDDYQNFNSNNYNGITNTIPRYAQCQGALELISTSNSGMQHILHIEQTHYSKKIKTPLRIRKIIRRPEFAMNRLLIRVIGNCCWKIYKK